MLYTAQKFYHEKNYITIIKIQLFNNDFRFLKKLSIQLLNLIIYPIINLIIYPIINLVIYPINKFNYLSN